MEINDELLLKEIIGFCESIKDEDELKKFQGNNKELPFYPLDSDVKNQLVMLMLFLKRTGHYWINVQYTDCLYR